MIQVRIKNKHKKLIALNYHLNIINANGIKPNPQKIIKENSLIIINVTYVNFLPHPAFFNVLQSY